MTIALSPPIPITSSLHDGMDITGDAAQNQNKKQQTQIPWSTPQCSQGIITIERRQCSKYIQAFFSFSSSQLKRWGCSPSWIKHACPPPRMLQSAVHKPCGASPRLSWH